MLLLGLLLLALLREGHTKLQALPQYPSTRALVLELKPALALVSVLFHCYWYYSDS